MQMQINRRICMGPAGRLRFEPTRTIDPSFWQPKVGPLNASAPAMLLARERITRRSYGSGRQLYSLFQARPVPATPLHIAFPSLERRGSVSRLLLLDCELRDYPSG